MAETTTKLTWNSGAVWYIIDMVTSRADLHRRSVMSFTEDEAYALINMMLDEFARDYPEVWDADITGPLAQCLNATWLETWGALIDEGQFGVDAT